MKSRKQPSPSSIGVSHALILLLFVILFIAPNSLYGDFRTVRDLKAPASAAGLSQQAVEVQGVVTSLSGWKNSFFLQDRTGSISIDRLEDTRIASGDVVRVIGTARPGLFAPVILSTNVAVVGHGPLPVPQRPSFEELSNGSFDSTWIEVRGVVRSAKIETVWDKRILLITLAVSGGQMSIHLLDYSGLDINTLVDSTVTVSGVCGTKFNERKQLIGLRLFVPRAAYLKIDKPAPSEAAIPLSAIDAVQRYSLDGGQLHRARIRGTLTYQSPERGLFLEKNRAAIHVDASQRAALKPGDQLEVLGFVHSFGYSPGLQDSQVSKLSEGRPIQPAVVQPSDVIKISDGFRTSAYDGRLVEMTGMVVEQIPNGQNALWLLREGNLLYQAELRGDVQSGQTSLEPRSQVKVIGICLIEPDDRGEPASFRLLLRSAKDISTIQSPYWQQSFFVLIAGLVLLLAGGCLLWVFEYRYANSGQIEALDDQDSTLCCRFKFISALLSTIVFCLAALSVFGLWNTGLNFAWGAAAVFYCRFQSGWKSRCSMIFASVALLQGALALCQFQNWSALSGIIRNAHLFPDTGVTIAVASCMNLLGVSVLVLRLERFKSLAQLGFIGVLAIGFLNLIMRVYHVSPLFGVARHTAMSTPTAACFYALSAAALLARPRSGFMKAVSASEVGGLVSRRLLPAAMIIPFILGWVRLQGQLLGLYDTLFGLSLFALLSVLSFGGVIWASAVALNRLDFTRSYTEKALRWRDERLELLFEKSGIGDYTWDIGKDEVLAHPIVWRLYGSDFPLESASSAWFANRQHPDDAAMIAAGVRAAMDGPEPLDLEFRVLLPGGGIRWIACRGSVVRDEAGAPSYINGLSLDITARKESEAALRQSIEAVCAAEQQLQTALEFSKIAVWRWHTANDRITWAGPVEEVYGRKDFELTNLRELQQLLHRDDVEELHQAINTCLKSGSDLRADFRIVMLDQVRWIAKRGGVIREADGTVCGMSGVSFDITSAKDAEELRRHSEQTFRLADSMPQIVWTADVNGALTYFNRQWYAYTGSVVGQDYWEFIHPEDVERSRALWLRSVATSEPFHCERRIKAFDNTYRWHLSRALPILGGDGKAEQWFGTSTDIDDAKRVQLQTESANQLLERNVEERSAQIAEIELRYRMLVDGVKDYAIFMLDTEGQVKSWNKGAEQLTGYAAHEIVGQHFSKLKRPEDIRDGDPSRSLVEATANGRHSEEGWRLRKNGDAFWANVVTTPLLDSRGELSGYSKIIRDMTEQRRAMSLLVSERQKADLANQAKSNFLASMSHEIRTPMNAILGMADLLSETELDEMQREFVGRFQRAGSHLMTIINDILDLSKIESGHFQLEEVPFDLEEVIQRAIDLVAPNAHRKKINLASRIVAGVRPNFIGDPGRLQQILLNLLGNAVKFTENGEIVLTVNGHSDQEPNHIQFEVSDTGIGIPEDKNSVIFDDFTQAESSTNRRFGGTGLGLGIARRLVQRMGGSLTLESKVGLGSKFTFDTIFRGGEPALGTDGQGILDDLSSQRILIVDTSETNQLIYREMCSSWTMDSESTNSARAAITLLKQGVERNKSYSIVLLDRFSSDLNAFEALEQIQSDWPRLPVILATDEDQPGEATRAKAAGFVDYVVKPIRKSRFLHMISAALMHKSGSLSADSSPANMSKSPEGPNVSVLLVDDSEDNRFLVEAYLLGSNYEVSFATDGQAALDRFSVQPFGLVLMDVQMPVLDGLQATAAFRALEKKVGRRPVPIIALTGNSMSEDISRTAAVGCNAHLSKPISKLELMKVLDQWQGHGKQATAENTLSERSAALTSPDYQP